MNQKKKIFYKTQFFYFLFALTSLFFSFQENLFSYLQQLKFLVFILITFVCFLGKYFLDSKNKISATIVKQWIWSRSFFFYFLFFVLILHVWLYLDLTDISSKQEGSQKCYLFFGLAFLCLAWNLLRESASTYALPASEKFWNVVTPFLFGLLLLFLWQMIVIGYRVPFVLLPPPTIILVTIYSSKVLLWQDFVQTFIYAVLPGFFIGCTAGFLVALICDKFTFLKKGLLPVGNFFSALPIVGIAPIMIMWFGFDWQSKAAVVVLMTFFPMLVNSVIGLNATSTLELDLMRTYTPNYFQKIFFVRLHNASPFLFNAFKINSTLALIGAIVSEFFGTPIVGMGFRISTEVGRMNLHLVWATVAVSALIGSIFYGVFVFLEKKITFWHISNRV